MHQQLCHFTSLDAPLVLGSRLGPLQYTTGVRGPLYTGRVATAAQAMLGSESQLMTQPVSLPSTVQEIALSTEK